MTGVGDPQMRVFQERVEYLRVLGSAYVSFFPHGCEMAIMSSICTSMLPELMITSSCRRDSFDGNPSMSFKCSAQDARPASYLAFGSVPQFQGWGPACEGP